MDSSYTDNAALTEALLSAGLRPTRQRLQLGKLLFSQACRHVTAETLHREAKEAGIPVSLATVYNTLHQFTEASLLREVNVPGGLSYFDTNVEDHHHFLCEATGNLYDIPHDHIQMGNLPVPPEGTEVSRIDVVIRLKAAAQS